MKEVQVCFDARSVNLPSNYEDIFLDYIVKEFIPRTSGTTPRAVNDVAWNRAPGHEHLLAAAYEKARSLFG